MLTSLSDTNKCFCKVKNSACSLGHATFDKANKRCAKVISGEEYPVCALLIVHDCGRDKVRNQSTKKPCDKLPFEIVRFS